MVRKMEFPRVVVVGEKSLDEIGNIAKELSAGNNAIMIADDTTMKIAGNKIKEMLENAKFEVSTHMTKVASNESVESARKAIKEFKSDIVLGVGGGTCIDVAKLSSFQEGLHFMSVPTAASHDGMCSPIASIRENGVLKSHAASAPIAIISDTKIIAGAPPRFLASGCGDLISNYTAVEDWKLARKIKGEYYGDYAAALSILSAEMIMDHAEAIAEKTEECIRTVMESLIGAGAAMCITGSSRPCSGADHMFSHALDRISPVHALHGEQCGIGAIMMAYLHKLDWARMKHVLERVGAPTTAKELGIKPEFIVKALAMAHTIRDRYTILGEKGITEKEAREVAEATKVI